MNSVPFDSWDQASAIFTFADSPGVLTICLIAMVAIVVGVIAQSARHENASFKKAKEES